MGSPTADYTAAGKKLKEACSEIDRLKEIIGYAAMCFNSYWKVATVSGTNIAFPAELTTKATRDHRGQMLLPINASVWPSGMQIAEALLAYHNCKANLDRLYQAIPADERDGVRNPREFDAPG